ARDPGPPAGPGGARVVAGVVEGPAPAAHPRRARVQPRGGRTGAVPGRHTALRPRAGLPRLAVPRAGPRARRPVRRPVHVDRGVHAAPRAGLRGAGGAACRRPAGPLRPHGRPGGVRRPRDPAGRHRRSGRGPGERGPRLPPAPGVGRVRGGRVGARRGRGASRRPARRPGAPGGERDAARPRRARRAEPLAAEPGLPPADGRLHHRLPQPPARRPLPADLRRGPHDAHGRGAARGLRQLPAVPPRLHAPGGAATARAAPGAVPAAGRPGL
ncbi:MAG: Transcriptional regulator, AraC family, partial [uncultured Solirubrobacteraceae bacterium]